MCFNQILFIGPAFKTKDKLAQMECNPGMSSKEGVSHVLDDYARHIHPFKYVACLKQEVGMLLSLWGYFIGAVKLFYYLLADPEIKIVHFLDEIPEPYQRDHKRRYWTCEFFGKYLLCILIRIVFNKKFVYHINGDGFSPCYAARGAFGKAVIRRLFFLTDMVLCPSEEDLAFLKGKLKCKLVFIVSEGIELQQDNVDHCMDRGLIHLLYFGGWASEMSNKGPGEDDQLKSAQNYLQKQLLDLLSVMEENRGLFQGKIKLLIAGLQPGNGFKEAQQKRLKYQQPFDNKTYTTITDSTDYTTEFTTDLGKKCIWEVIHQKHLEDLVSYVDCSTPSLKSSLFKMANICLMPAGDGRGRTRYLEAMNYGLPIIATAKGSNYDMVLNGINGFLIRGEQKGGVRSAIRHFLLHPTDASLMGAASKELVQKFDIQNVLVKLKFIYSNLLN